MTDTLYAIGGAVIVALVALLGLGATRRARRPRQPSPSPTIAAAAEGEARRVERLQTEHRAEVAEVEGRATLPPAEHRRRSSSQFRDGT